MKVIEKLQLDLDPKSKRRLNESWKKNEKQAIRIKKRSRRVEATFDSKTHMDLMDTMKQPTRNGEFEEQLNVPLV